jgi:tRNA threonylcarbamoyl adenosine modification protein YeaZ
MKILAFETTDAVASVALYVDGTVFETVIATDLRHAESVLPAAEALLSAHGLSTADMDAFAADVGPGSFTGVRIGVCMANALGAAHHKSVVAVNALEALVYPYREETVCALIDARNGNGYGAVYAAGEPIKAPCACVIADFTADLPADCRMVGTATDTPELPSAASVARIAAGREGEKEIAPLYLKLSQAERLWKS